MPGSKRDRDLARRRAERQAARRAAAAARTRRRNAVLATILAVLVVVAGTAALAGSLSGRDSAADPAQAAPGSPPGACSYPEAGTAAKKASPPATSGVPDRGTFLATLQTNVGRIAFEMDAAKAPCTVHSLRSLAQQSYFDQTPCHRLVTSGLSVLQCGDPSGKGTGGPGYRFANENLDGATYPRGTVAMANSGPDTNGSQFFLVYADSPLPPDYTPFGRITAGLDVLERVAAAGSTPAQDGAPKKAVTIQTLRVTSQR